MLKSWGWWVGGVVVGWPKILVSAPVPLKLILTGFDWVGAGPWGFGFGTGLDNILILTCGAVTAKVIWM